MLTSDKRVAFNKAGGGPPRVSDAASLAPDARGCPSTSATAGSGPPPVDGVPLVVGSVVGPYSHLGDLLTEILRPVALSDAQRQIQAEADAQAAATFTRGEGASPGALNLGVPDSPLSMTCLVVVQPGVGAATTSRPTSARVVVGVLPPTNSPSQSLSKDIVVSDTPPVLPPFSDPVELIGVTSFL